MKLGKRSTENQWSACTEPGDLLPFLRLKLDTQVTARKLLLFACACWRSVAHILADTPSGAARSGATIKAVEQFLDDRGGLAEVDDARRQCGLLRDLFGNPFRPLPLCHFPAHVLALAETCYEAFPKVSDNFLILADALEELGEEQAAKHARRPVHAKGCHMLD